MSGHSMAGHFMTPGFCIRCCGFAQIDLPRTCPNRPMTPFESANVRARKLEFTGGQWEWNPTVDWESHGEPNSVNSN